MKRKNKSERLKRILAIICAGMVALAIVASVVLPVMAATQTQIDAAKQKSEQAKKDKQNAEAKHKTILEEYKSLDKQISDTDDLNANYHIGPSYFLKLPELDYDYDILWADYLQPLLEEYLRGSYEEQESLAAMKSAYELATPVEEEFNDEA